MVSLIYLENQRSQKCSVFREEQLYISERKRHGRILNVTRTALELGKPTSRQKRKHE